jgi:hypothetical protein
MMIFFIGHLVYGPDGPALMALAGSLADGGGPRQAGPVLNLLSFDGSQNLNVLRHGGMSQGTRRVLFVAGLFLRRRRPAVECGADGMLADGGTMNSHDNTPSIGFPTSTLSRVVP